LALQWQATNGKEFGHDAHDQLWPVHHAQFGVQAPHVRMDGVRRDLQINGDGEFRLVVEHRAHNLNLAPGKAQAKSDGIPNLV
jgi:hypothetical protein